jgi:hypothetical protein
MNEDNAAALVRVGDKVGVRVLVPEQPGAMGQSTFRDGFHLTPAGAQIFTTKLGPEL